MIKATGIAVPQQPRLAGGSLVEYGQGVESSATHGLAAASQMEQKRDAANQQIEQSNKSGGAAVGSVVGGIAGSFFGPLGTMVGSAAGGMLGSMLG